MACLAPNALRHLSQELKYRSLMVISSLAIPENLSYIGFLLVERFSRPADGIYLHSQARFHGSAIRLSEFGSS